MGTRPWDVRSTLQRWPGQSMVGWGGVSSKGRREGAKEAASSKQQAAVVGDAVGRCWGGLCAGRDAVETLEEQLLEMC